MKDQSSQIAESTSASPTQITSQPSLAVSAVTPPILLKETSNAAIFLSPGVNLPVLLDPFVRALLDGTSFAGFRVPPCSNLTCLFAERVDLAEASALWKPDIAAGRVNAVRPQTSTTANFLCTEGVALVRTLCPPKADALVVTVAGPGKHTPLLVDQVPALVEAMQDRCSNAVVVFKGCTTESTRGISSYFDASLCVEPCQPDPGYAAAYIVSALPGTFLSATAGLPVIENIRQRADGQLERKSYPCHSKDPLTREMAHLHLSGFTLDDIGHHFGVNKSTVHRRLELLNIRRGPRPAAR